MNFTDDLEDIFILREAEMKGGEKLYEVSR